MQYSVQDLELVDTTGCEAFDNITQLASTVFAAPVSLVSILDHVNDRQFFISQTGLPSPYADKRQTPLKHSYSRHVVADNAVLRIPNAREDIRFQHNPVVITTGMISYLGAPVHNTHGKPLGALAIMDSKPRVWTDRQSKMLVRLAACITESIKLKSSLLDKEALLAEQTEFNYSISHDLKSPVNTLYLILNEVAEMHRSGDYQESEDFVSEALNTTHRMHTMIEDTLDYIQITNTEDLQRESVSLETTVANIKNSMADQIIARNASITTNNLPTVTADPTLMTILFQQLISNAIKFQTPGKPPEIFIVDESTKDDSYHKIVVSDNGIGIDAEHHALVFSLFSRLHTRDQYLGTGLGLSICRRIVGFYGGRLSIGASTSLENGTSFVIHLPRSTFLCPAA